MSTVQLFLQIATGPVLLDSIDEDRIRAHSSRVDDTLGPKTTTSLPIKTVTLTGAAPGPLKYILERIKNNQQGRTLHIKVHDMPLPKVVAVFEAYDVLQVQPAQLQIENHIVGHISHHVTAPDEMVAVARCFYQRQETSRVWRVLIQQVGWNVVHGKYTSEQTEHLQKTAREAYPALENEVVEKIKELKAKKDQREWFKELEAMRKG